VSRKQPSTPHDQVAARSRKKAVPDGGTESSKPSLSSGESSANLTFGWVLKGAKSADLPVQQPTTFELVINLKTAKELGLTIPQSILGRADEVIE
jgi:putative ABC transport system substrate-binding protein